MIGRGGMGVVYLARDTKLDRSVAIKSMPVELQTNSTARTRFTREAKLLASLSHPNIGVIHDIIEPTEGNAYLVLEYIPGETLAERMARGPLGLNEALSIALQIARAVCAAHEAGVIHRDLKPSNIKITPDGLVKVLDFGLAKTTIGKSAAPDPTVTEAGRIMGTPAYMSPEQARGKPMDRRTDIWSFGCLLYEMLTGHLPFEGETTTDVLARIIERNPDWNRLPPRVPPNIRVLLWRCLAKDPQRRIQHLGDAVLELDETLNVPPDKPSVGEPEVGMSRHMLWWLAAACGFAGLVVGLIATSLFLSRPAAPSLSKIDPASTSRTLIRLPEDQVLGFFQAAAFGIRQPAFDLSPDGSRLVYTAYVGNKTQLFERMINQYEIRPIPGTDGAACPFFSPNGQSVGFFADGMLKVVSLQGGEPRMLCSAGSAASGSWSDDDMIYFVSKGVLSRVPATGGSIEEQGLKFDYFWGYMQVLPGSKAVIFSSLRDGAVHASLETMQKKVLERNVLYAHYVPTGHLVYVRAGAIEAVPFNLTTLKKTGPSVPVIPRILSDSVYGSAQFAFSNNGSLVYVPGGDTAKSTLVWVDRQGNEEPLPMTAQNYGTFKLSPDGTKLAIVVNELQSNVYSYDIAKNTRIRLTLEGQNGHPIWTPDGRRITFDRRTIKGEENSNILWQPADGSREAEVLHSSQHFAAPFSWSPDGKLLAFIQMHPNSESDIWGLKPEGNGEPELIVGTKFTDHFPAFSPDGRWLTYMSSREGTSKVYVQPYPALNQTITISDNFGEEPIWSPKADELFYRSGNKWVVASIATEPEFTVEKRQVLFEGSYINIGGLSYDVAPDGQRLLVLKPQFDDSQIRELHVVANWFEELKRLVPTNEE